MENQWDFVENTRSLLQNAFLTYTNDLREPLPQVQTVRPPSQGRRASDSTWQKMANQFNHHRYHRHHHHHHSHEMT